MPDRHKTGNRRLLPRKNGRDTERASGRARRREAPARLSYLGEIMSAQEAPEEKKKRSVALSGIAAGNTAICTVGRTGNDLHYRGYDILDFAELATFEEIAYLLVHEKLPSQAEL